MGTELGNEEEEEEVGKEIRMEVGKEVGKMVRMEVGKEIS